MLENFLQAIHHRTLLRITFFSKEDGRVITRRCAPLDYGPSRRAKDKSNRFHFLDLDSDSGRHPLSLMPVQIRMVEVLDEGFSPEEIVTWDTTLSPWYTPRDWGRVS